MNRIVSFLSLLALAACSATIHPEDYDASCTEDADCVVIFTGDVCSCSCDVAAINVSEEPRYQEDRGTQSCGISCGPCPGVDAVCTAHLCKAVPSP